MAGTRLKNKAQVRRYLLSHDVLVQVVNYILDEIYKQNTEVVNRIVYTAYNPSEYQRTYEFRDSWGTDGAKASGIHVKGEFKYLPEKMTYNPELAQHGSPDWYHGVHGGDARTYLADIIYDGLSGNLFGNGQWRKSRDAWDALLKEVGVNNIAKWTKQGFKNVGLNVRLNTTNGMELKST